MVEGFTSFTLTPPLVIIASSYPRSPTNVSLNSFSTSISLCLSSLVTELTFLYGSIPDLSTTTSIILIGSRSPREFLKSLFAYFLKSLRSLASSISLSIAGFRSMYMSISFPIYLCIYAEALITSGPLMPKWVNSISPCSSNIFFFPLLM